MRVPTVVIIGGGCSGAGVAYYLVGLHHTAIRIIVYEPRPRLGAGLAYSATDPLHRINVPARRMSLLPDDPDHFARWAAVDDTALRDRDALLPDGRSFPARDVFGRYVAAQLQPLLDCGAIEHPRTRALRAELVSGQWHILAEDGSKQVADILVLATSHPPPAPPRPLQALMGEPKFITDPWRPAGLDAIAPDDKVLIVGTGLTMADVVVSLDAKGRRGNITAISRRGQRSRGHALVAHEPVGDFLSPPPRTALALLRRARQQVKDAKELGLGWQTVFDRLRDQSPEVWRGLPLSERRRIVRHLRPFWDTHRFRIAPQVEAVLERRIADDTLSIVAARVLEAEATAQGFRVGLKPRFGTLKTELFDAIITTTGPDHAHAIGREPVLASLAAAGLLRPDALSLGLLVDSESRAIAGDGSTGTLFVAGPLARGTFGELMGLPEVTRHALFVAEQIDAALMHRTADNKEAVPQDGAALIPRGLSPQRGEPQQPSRQRVEQKSQ